MKIHLILTVCIAIYRSSSSVLSQDHIEDQTVTSKVKDESQIRENFQSLFDSMAKNDAKKSEMYREILKKELTREQQAFDVMKEEVYITRIKNYYKNKSFDKNGNIIVAKREANENNDTNKLSTTTVRQYTLKPPVDLHEIGYNGTWQQFCDRNEIDKDSPPYPEHSLRVLRLDLCHRQELNKFSSWMMEPFAAYKHCVITRPETDELLEILLRRFSEGDDEKRAKLFTLGVPEYNSLCVRDAQEWLRVFCIDRDNPYFSMFYALLARACTLPWLKKGLTMQTMMKEECNGRRIPAAPWMPLLASIKYHE